MGATLKTQQVRQGKITAGEARKSDSNVKLP